MAQLIETEQFPTAAFVVVCDRSHSMKQSGALAVLDGFLPQMVLALKNHKRVRETGILSIVGFSAEAEVLLPMAHITQAVTPAKPSITPGMTNFGPPLDVAMAQLQQMPEWTSRCYRPVMFFLSDGNHNVGPHSAWHAARQRLVDASFALRPTIVALGMGESDMPTLRTIASRPELCRHFDGEPIEAVRSILEIVLKSTITLSQIQREGVDEDDLVAQIRRFRYDDDYRGGELINWSVV